MKTWSLRDWNSREIITERFWKGIEMLMVLMLWPIFVPMLVLVEWQIRQEKQKHPDRFP